LTKILSGLLMEVYLAMFSCIIVIEWYDVFCVRKNEKNNFSSSIIRYVSIYLILECFSDIFLAKVSLEKEIIFIFFEIVRLISECIMEWLLFIRKYKGTTVKKILVYILCIIIMPVLKMLILALMDTSVIEVRVHQNYIETINNFTIMVVSYLLIVIVGELCRSWKSKKSNIYILPFIMILIVQIGIHNYFEKVVIEHITTVNASVYLLAYAFLATAVFCICLIYKKHLSDQAYMNKEKERHSFYERKISYYQETHNRLNELKKVEHDFKKHLLILKELSRIDKYDELNGYIDSLANHILPTTEVIDGQNIVISAQLTYAKARCDENEIEFKYVLEYQDIQMDDFILNTILGNIIDNAVEASIKIKDVSKRRIQLSIQKEKDMLMIGCRNRYTGIIKRAGETFVSSKQDEQNHGLGIINIKEAVEKLDGKVEIKTTKRTFDIHVILQNIP